MSFTFLINGAWKIRFKNKFKIPKLKPSYLPKMQKSAPQANRKNSQTQTASILEAKL
ncbi:hypothetical protein CAL7716_079920 [Calothrix sp. PCC 7716]|nr:hypothetical protein CAL7716_079920 [Calothrix sp. PCC 7716]